MFVLKKLITPFILPPGLFILVLGGCCVWVFIRGNRRMLAYFIPLTALIWLMSFGPVADLLVAPLESYYPIPQEPKADVIIMLTGGFYEGAPDLSGTGAPGPDTMERLVTAARLHRRLHVPIIVSGGKVFPGDPAICVSAKRFLVDLGIDSDQVIGEDRSRDTYENALYSKEICNRLGFTQPLIVTSASHMRRSMLCFDRVGFPATPFPCALTTWPDMNYAWHSLLPSAGALRKTYMAMHEWLGLIFYSMSY